MRSQINSYPVWEWARLDLVTDIQQVCSHPSKQAFQTEAELSRQPG